MENPRPEKVATVTEIAALLQGSDAALLTEYRGMSVANMSTLRRTLAANGAEYRVFKNTLVVKAAQQIGLTGLDDLLKGPTAVAFVKGDAVEAAKALKEFAKTNTKLVGLSILVTTKATMATSMSEYPMRLASFTAL